MGTSIYIFTVTDNASGLFFEENNLDAFLLLNIEGRDGRSIFAGGS